MPCICGAPSSDQDLGIEISEIYDGILMWQCWKCGQNRPRFESPDRLHSLAVGIIEKWNEHDRIS